MKVNWIADKIESLVANIDLIDDKKKERERFLSSTLHLNDKERKKERIDQIILSSTLSYHLSKNNFGYQMIEEPGHTFFIIRLGMWALSLWIMRLISFYGFVSNCYNVFDGNAL